jgi:hypothetical protein
VITVVLGVVFVENEYAHTEPIDILSVIFILTLSMGFPTLAALRSRIWVFTPAGVHPRVHDLAEPAPAGDRDPGNVFPACAISPWLW